MHPESAHPARPLLRPFVIENKSTSSGCFETVMCTKFIGQWRRSVVKSGVQGQSGQAIKLFHIAPYVNDFRTLNNFLTPCTVRALKN